MASQTFAISAGGNDGYAILNGGTFDNSGTSMALGNTGTLSTTAAKGFLLFSSIAIPKNAVISTAYITFVAATTDSSTVCKVRIYAEAADNPTAPTTYGDLAGRSYSTAYASWTLAAQTAGTSYQSASLVSVIQEQVNRAGWSSGNNIHLILPDDSSDNNAQRDEATFEHASYTEPRLYVEWVNKAAQVIWL